jgi:two-component system, chemotaxis family, chemotaxis protein CheY
MTDSTRHAVLLVDDDRVTRLALASLVRRMPELEVVEAEDGFAAWEMLRGGLRPVACCTDLQMPRMDGVALLRRAREHPLLAYLPVILVTGVADRASVDAAITHRAAGFIVKPFAAANTRNLLERAIRTCLAAWSESPALTLERLHQAPSGLRQMLDMLQEDIARVLAGAGCAPGHPGLAAHITRVRGGCQTLGLWRAVQVCDAAWPVPRSGLELASALREMGEDVTRQLKALRASTPSAYR